MVRGELSQLRCRFSREIYTVPETFYDWVRGEKYSRRGCSRKLRNNFSHAHKSLFTVLCFIHWFMKFLKTNLKWYWKKWVNIQHDMNTLPTNNGQTMVKFYVDDEWRKVKKGKIKRKLRNQTKFSAKCKSTTHSVLIY